MRPVSLRDFLHLSRLTEQACIELLAAGQLPVVLACSGEVQIDLDRLPPLESLRHPTPSAQTPALLEEQIATAVLAELEGIIQEATAVASRRRAAKTP